ncbi:Receptor-type guanylate cyclase gcy [Seminavis robusta]|uniref:Receptor-type guanylate cyclase gcy n=1 Tax=Seminavis robusta TaxID=568900 RepID=A0A9N8HTB5_9STRA|nr:Receptor-type guanylate cyclase gcy [Seminavis robusta]|eukprot:Sro1851_g301650.1 Receptor-type guanylate cyclase gcy (1274) ;mRNA; r:6627-11511
MIPSPPESAPAAELTNLRAGEDVVHNDDASVGVCVSEIDSSAHDRSGSGITSSHRSDSQDEESARKKEQEQLAKEETNQINRLRWLVFKVLLLAALVISIIVFMISRNAQQDTYHKSYDGAAQHVTDAFQDIMVSKMGAVSSMGVALIAHGRDHYRDWPFVTLSSFQQRASTALVQSGAIYLHFNPLVTNETRHEWEQEYVVGPEAVWIDEAIAYQDHVGIFEFDNHSHDYHSQPVPVQEMDEWKIWDRTNQGLKEDEEDDTTDGPYMPTWQTSPLLHGGRLVNENILQNSVAAQLSFDSASVVMGSFWMSRQRAAEDETELDDHAHLRRKRRSLVGTLFDEDYDHGTAQGDDMYSLQENAVLSELLSASNQQDTVYQGTPISQVYFPIFDSFDEENRTTVAVMVAWIHWSDYFRGVLPDNVQGIQIVLRNTCADDHGHTRHHHSTAYTFDIYGEHVTPVGPGDQHNKKYDQMVRKASFESIQNIADGTKNGLPFHKEHCTIHLEVYPTDVFYQSYHNSTPIVLTLAVAVVFLVAVAMFLVYDRLVERRQKLVMNRAAQTTAIVSSLFPENVRDRIMSQQAAGRKADKRGSSHERGSTVRNSGSNFLAPSRRLKGYLIGNGETGGEQDDQQVDPFDDTPIADLFPHCTVLFADISGFTAWSSTRDPAQVFILLQTLYEAFDKIANRRKVFKVETIGDSYVAVTGLPEPQSTHAVIMARFAGECMTKMHQLVALLETRLGPDTGELSMRFGLHSGPVTAGVLKGERARFQLFGDTVNTAARMESTGIRNKIQVSQSTYDLIVEGGKAAWAKPRPDKVEAKGKGMLQTYFINPSAKRGSTTESTASDEQSGSGGDASSRMLQASSSAIVAKPMHAKPGGKALSMKESRLVDWIVDLLHEHVKKLAAIRSRSKSKSKSIPSSEEIMYRPPEGQTSMDEVAETILLPKFSLKNFAAAEEFRSVTVDPVALEQLRDLVATIASMYQDNDFHNFEHACHVTMATNKLLKRIETPDINIEQGTATDNQIASDIHQYTHGINSDPLTLLAIVFSALIHDVDHRGVSNVQLAVEQPDLRDKYNNKSVAEQNSLDLAWDLLMDDKYEALRRCLFATHTELRRFRQVLVNVVLATDIFDKELNGLRRKRWDKAFSSDLLSHEEHNNLRATIVIEHIIQASDVSHTMQHWHIYRKWNRRLFHELYHAYKAGRMAKDPSTFWYNGEIGFFDNYVIPLAKKLKDCHVFGVSSDECLNYALQNRNEWKTRGQQIVEEMLQELAMEEEP